VAPEDGTGRFVKGTSSRSDAVAVHSASSQLEAYQTKKHPLPPVGLNLPPVGSNAWAEFVLVIGALLLIDYYIVQHIHGDSTVTHLVKFIGWIAVAAVYLFRVRSVVGGPGAVFWSSGYMLEALFAIDNLFIFHVIFRYYSTPRRLQEKALFVCLLGQICIRTIFYTGMALVCRRFIVITYAAGILLVLLGIHMLLANGFEQQVLQEHASPGASEIAAIRWTKSLIGADRFIDTYDEEGDSFFLSGTGNSSSDSNGGKQKVQATLLVVVVITMLLTDFFFAIDVVIAKIEEIGHFYINFTSGIMSLFAIKALYFLIADLVDHITLLSYSLGCILIFIGSQLLFSETYQMSALASCGVILVIMSTFLIWSGLQRICGHLTQDNNRCNSQLHDSTSSQADGTWRPRVHE